MDPFYVTLGLMVAAGALGFYIGRVGLSGIEADISAIKADLSSVKTAVVPTLVVPPIAPVPSVPVVV
jgi:hypothetical protein